MNLYQALLLVLLFYSSLSCANDTKLNLELCDYNIEETFIYSCKAMGCKTKICIGSVKCKTDKNVSITIDVSCQVTGSGECPALASDCMKDKTIELQEPNKEIYHNNKNSESSNSLSI